MACTYIDYNHGLWPSLYWRGRYTRAGKRTEWERGRRGDRIAWAPWRPGHLVGVAASARGAVASARWAALAVAVLFSLTGWNHKRVVETTTYSFFYNTLDSFLLYYLEST